LSVVNLNGYSVDLYVTRHPYHYVLDSAYDLSGHKLAVLGVYLYYNVGGRYLKLVNGNKIPWRKLCVYTEAFVKGSVKGVDLLLGYSAPLENILYRSGFCGRNRVLCILLTFLQR
jgi:hypothetical protein